MMLANKYQSFLDAFSRWANEHPDIEAAVLVGSHARGAATMGSDVDLVVLTSGVDRYLHDRTWVSAFGEPLECVKEDYGRVTSLRVFYREGLEVEYGFTTPEWAAFPIDEGTRQVVEDGMKVLYDPHGIIARMQRQLRSNEN
ncbi:MAG TPA: nucleotidyltransferase domain-containing protein [Pyrinomonadaceae bacterium]|nr:nucleotidyltransferase domain-containing protein [Pyrinomonadaceae bacterium]